MLEQFIFARTKIHQFLKLNKKMLNVNVILLTTLNSQLSLIFGTLHLFQFKVQKRMSNGYHKILHCGNTHLLN
jgi:hypothetical protein